MILDELINYADSLDGVEASFPFGEDTLVYKIANKIFLLISLGSSPLSFNVKCDPERAIALREEFACVQPGYHMNKKHWNTVIVDNTISNSTLKQFIDHSYELVAPKKNKKKV